MATTAASLTSQTWEIDFFPRFTRKGLLTVPLLRKRFPWGQRVDSRQPAITCHPSQSRARMRPPRQSQPSEMWRWQKPCSRSPVADLTYTTTHPPTHTDPQLDSKWQCSAECSVSTTVTSWWVSSPAPQDLVSHRRGCSAPFSLFLPCLLFRWQGDSQKSLVHSAEN